MYPGYLGYTRQTSGTWACRNEPGRRAAGFGRRKISAVATATTTESEANAFCEAIEKIWRNLHNPREAAVVLIIATHHHYLKLLLALNRNCKSK